jgi:hypothetical protein
MAGEPGRFARELQSGDPQRDAGGEGVGVAADTDPDVHL